jgi:hypothetical protein
MSFELLISHADAIEAALMPKVGRLELRQGL